MKRTPIVHPLLRFLLIEAIEVGLHKAFYV